MDIDWIFADILWEYFYRIFLYIVPDIWLEPILKNFQKKSVHEQTTLRTQKILHLEPLPMT